MGKPPPTLHNLRGQSVSGAPLPFLRSRHTQAPGDTASLAGRALNTSGSQLQGTREEGWHAGRVTLGRGAVSLGKARVDPEGQQSMMQRKTSSSLWSPGPATFELDDPGRSIKYISWAPVPVLWEEKGAPVQGGLGHKRCSAACC